MGRSHQSFRSTFRAACYATSVPIAFAAPAPVVERISPAPAVCAAPVPVVKYVAPAALVPAVEHTSPDPTVYAAKAPVEEFIAPVPVELFRGAYSACCTSSCRGKHFSRSYGVCRKSSCGGVHCSSASGKLCRISACCVCRTSSYQGMHFSSASCSACRTCFYCGVSLHLQLDMQGLHLLWSTPCQHQLHLWLRTSSHPRRWSLSKQLFTRLMRSCAVTILRSCAPWHV